MQSVIFQGWLKRAGKLLISDYCCSEGDHSKEFKDYLAQRGYHPLTPANYGKVSDLFNILKLAHSMVLPADDGHIATRDMLYMFKPIVIK